MENGVELIRLPRGLLQDRFGRIFSHPDPFSLTTTNLACSQQVNLFNKLSFKPIYYPTLEL